MPCSGDSVCPCECARSVCTTVIRTADRLLWVSAYVLPPPRSSLLLMVQSTIWLPKALPGEHYPDLSLDGRSAADQLQALGLEAARLTEQAYECWQNEILPALEGEGVQIADYGALTEIERAPLDQFFQDAVFPVLTPLGYDPGRPFPHISSLSLNLAVVLQDRSGVERFARVKIPDTIDQLVSAPGVRSGVVRFVWLEQIILANLGTLFPGTRIVDAYPFRVTRDAEVEIQEIESDDLLETIEEAVWQRRFRHIVRLEINRELPPSVQTILAKELDTRPDQAYWVRGPLGLMRLFQLPDLNLPRLKYKRFVPYSPGI